VWLPAAAITACVVTPTRCRHPTHRTPPLLHPAPHSQSLTLRAHSAAEMEDWIAAIMSPLVELGKIPTETAAVAGAGAPA